MGVQDLESLRVVDEQPDRQVRVKLLEQLKVDDACLRSLRLLRRLLSI